jgi:hypothetical protein
MPEFDKKDKQFFCGQLSKRKVMESVNLIFSFGGSGYKSNSKSILTILLQMKKVLSSAASSAVWLKISHLQKLFFSTDSTFFSSPCLSAG